MKRLRVEANDIISQLSDNLLVHILSFLLMKDVVRTSVLSKRWRGLWTMLPNLNFGKICCYSSAFEDKFMNFILRLLCRQSNQNINIEKFRLILLDYKSNIGSNLNLWFPHLNHCNIKELIFKDKSSRRWTENCSFPWANLSAKSLVLLHIRGFKFYTDACADIKLFSLRKLFLSNVFIRDSMIRKFLTSCLALQELKLESCTGIKNLNITGLSDLKTLILTNNFMVRRVEINEPSLEYCVCLDTHGTCEIDFKNCANLKRLILLYTNINDEWLNKLLSIAIQLEHLQINVCHRLNSVTILSNHLKFLSLEGCGESFEGEINAPNLESLVFEGEGMISLNTNVSSKFKANINLCPEVVDDNWLIGLIVLLRKINLSKGMKLVSNIPNSRIPKEVTKYISDSKIVDELLQHQQLGDCLDFGIIDHLGIMDFLQMIFPNVKFQSSE